VLDRRALNAEKKADDGNGGIGWCAIMMVELVEEKGEQCGKGGESVRLN
jgi:hypothetical protein